MSEVASNDLFHGLSSFWEPAIGEGRQREVILSTVLAYCLFRERKEEGLELAALIYAKSAIDSILEKMGQPIPKPTLACSFCYRTEPDVRLAAGPNVFICDSCVSTLSEVFQEKTSE